MTVKIALTPDLVKERVARGILGVVDAVAPKLGTKTCIGPSEIRGVGGILVLARHEGKELRTSQQTTSHSAPRLTSSRLACASDLRYPCSTRYALISESFQPLKTVDLARV